LYPKETQNNPFFKVLFLLSGPEPQRTYLESKIRQQVAALEGNFALVQGLPGKADSSSSKVGNLHIFPYLQAEELSDLISNSHIILCRAGYSTLMDLAFFGKKAIFIPTPGQTEQIYLAEQLHEANRGFTVSQDQFVLSVAIEEAEKTIGFPSYQPSFGEDLLSGAIQHLLLQCKK
jgi:UDP-N-acetylglucosamine:LPS N-acetylglucosamine transferase